MVAPDGSVAGSFTRDTDTLPHRICAFSLTGHLQPDGQAVVEVSSPLPVPEAKPIKGRLAVTKDGVALQAQGLTEYPACDQLDAADARVVEFGRIAPADGTWLASVVAKRAQLHLAPTGSAWRGYLVKDDYVALGGRKGERWEAVFLSPAGRRSHGWIDASDVALFPRR